MKNRLFTLTLLSIFLVAAFSAHADLKTISYQGLATDAVGDPVTDGPHTFDFSMHTSEVGGIIIWFETGIVVNTTDGLFSTELGSSTPIDNFVFEANDSLWLEVIVDGETITPRTYLNAVPYAKIAGGLKAYSSNFDIDVFKTQAFFPRLTMFGGDSLEQFRLWGENWGEIFLFDEDPNNYLEAILTANSAGGGGLYLYDDGASKISLQAGVVGDISVSIPTDAINADEILNEPGIASTNTIDFFAMGTSGGTNYVVDSVEINAPTAGYITVMCSGYFWVSHANGTTTELAASIEADNNFDFVSGTAASLVVAADASKSFGQPYSCLSTFSVSAGTNKFYLNAGYFTGANTCYVSRTKIVAMFTPTMYGTVELAPVAKSSVLSSAPTGTSADNEQNFESITVEQHKAKLAAQRRLLESEFEERLRKIEERLEQDSQKETSVSDR